MIANAIGRVARTVGLSLIVGVTLELAACGGDDDTTLVDGSLSIADLSTSEVDSLYYMREEEKLAHDVYVALYDVWKDIIFSNIADSEQSHTDSVKALIEKYNLIDPAANNPPGVFTDPKFQQIYDEYVALGSKSRLNALTVGVTIEELDIKDISNWLLVVDNADIRKVYESLLCGSRNHLRSYYPELVKSNGTYVPQFITQAEFEAIVSSPMENCG